MKFGPGRAGPLSRGWPAGRHAAFAGAGSAAAGVGRRATAGGQLATCLIRAISSSVALSTGTFSLMMRFMAFAQTFSLLSTVNL